MMPFMINGRAIVPAPFCSGQPDNKSFQAHPWLRIGDAEFECPICDAYGRL